VKLERSLVTGWRLRLVERLADRWSVVHEGGLTLRFEFEMEADTTSPISEGGRSLVRPVPSDLRAPTAAGPEADGGPPRGPGTHTSSIVP
jgi:hypothetical protein